MNRPFFLLCATIPGFLFASLSLDETMRRVHDHLLIGDKSSALSEAKKGIDSYASSPEMVKLHIETLFACGYENEGLRAFDEYSTQFSSFMQSRELLEEMGWGIVERGVESHQMAVRLSSLVGAFLTNDTRGVSIILKMMKDSNAVIRAVAIQMAAQFSDASLKDEIRRLLNEEKIWMVRLEVIRSAGMMHIKDLAAFLKNILTSDRNTYEERKRAIEALVEMADSITQDELRNLAKNQRSDMRLLACQFAKRFHMVEAQETILPLVFDAHPDVRVAALNTLGLLYISHMETETALDILVRSMADPHPVVSITAAWAAMLVDPPISETTFLHWLQSDLPEDRRLAAAALAATGDRGLPFKQKIMAESKDRYVRMNIALGLLGQRVDVSSAADIIYDSLQNEERLWMWDNRLNPLFHTFAPSEVRIVDQIPNYPEAIDQTTRLQLVSLLAFVDDHRSQEALKAFLKKRSWGLTGAASALLLQEGDAVAIEDVYGLVHDPDANVRMQAALVLALFNRDDSVLAELEKAYSEVSYEKKLHILEALGQVGSTEKIPFLVKTMHEPFPILRVTAAASLIRSLIRS